MTIQRQYSLPNCTLTLEGIGDEATEGTFRPLLSVLVNAECRFVGHEQIITGGMDFFEQLIRTTSRYTQQLLSGVELPTRHAAKSSSLVELTMGDHQRHHLTVKSASGGNGQLAELETAVELKLSTVQLFDLMEAIDQALADSQTLPQLGFKVSPLPRREVVSREPVVKRALPAALGISGFAIAAIALFFVPIPEVERREDPRPSLESESPTDPNPDDASTSPVPSPVDPQTLGEGATPTAPEPTQEEVEAVLDEATPMSDPDEILALNQVIRTQIDETWDRDGIEFDEPLIYRVGANPSGQIVGYRYVNDAALTYVEATPLPDLRAVPNPAALRTPIGQYRVVLNPDGVIEVSPWFALPEQPEPTAAVDSTDSPGASAAAWADSPTIDDGAVIERLTLDLYDAVQDVWSDRDNTSDWVYRATLNQNGEVLALEPENSAARANAGNAPLDELPTANTATGQADFRIVLTESGVLEVSPWDGYPD